MLLIYFLCQWFSNLDIRTEYLGHYKFAPVRECSILKGYHVFSGSGSFLTKKKVFTTKKYYGILSQAKKNLFG